MSEEAPYFVISQVKHNGQVYAPGSVIELVPIQAEPLLSDGIISKDVPNEDKEAVDVQDEAKDEPQASPAAQDVQDEGQNDSSTDDGDKTSPEGQNEDNDASPETSDDEANQL